MISPRPRRESEMTQGGNFHPQINLFPTMGAVAGGQMQTSYQQQYQGGGDVRTNSHQGAPNSYNRPRKESSSNSSSSNSSESDSSYDSNRYAKNGNHMIYQKKGQ